MNGVLHVMRPYLRRGWRSLAVAAASALVVALAEILRPFPLKLVVDHLFASVGAPIEIGPDELMLLAGITGLVLGIALVEAGGGYIMDINLARAGERTVHDLRVAIYAHLQRLSLGFHRQRHTGDLVTRVTGDVNAVGSLLSSSLGTLVTAALTLIGMVVVGFLLDPVLAFVAFATAPFIALVAFRFRNRMAVLQREQRSVEGQIASLATEALASMEQVKALGSGQFEHERLERKSRERLEAGYEATLVEGRFTRLIDIVGAVGTAAVLVVGVLRVSEGAISPGDLVVMVTYTRRIYRPLRAMAREWVRFARSMARAERVAELLVADDVLEERTPGASAPPGRAQGALHFESVSFSYRADKAALHDVSLAIEPGQRIALVGRSGAGKSTLAALAARFYDPGSGCVLIDGVDARDVPLDWLREQVGLVLQDPVLFTGSVAENIAWGFDAKRPDVVRAASAAGADDFIRGLPDGYDTELDPGGTGLSGGQLQRIAIARTLLRDPSILILDEPTNGLDAQSERDVLAGLDVLMEGRTTIIITHSLALAARAERVLVLEAGRLVEEGPPAEMLGPTGAYARLLSDGDLRENGLPAASAAGPVLISDPGLPKAAHLLDPRAVAPLLARSFDPGIPLDVSVRYLRYKPGTNLVVQYEVNALGASHVAVGMIASGEVLARRATKASNVALAKLVGRRAPVALPLSYEPEVDGLFQWYPLDISLPTLASPPAELRRILGAAGLSVAMSDDEPERLAYKPRRRAVLRLDGHVVKLYRRQAEFDRAVIGQLAASGLRAVATARLEAVINDRLLTAQSHLSGSPVSDAAAVAEEAGRLLRALHASPLSGLPRFSATDQLDAASASAHLVGAISADLRPRLDRLVQSMADRVPADVELVPSHGDFNARQLLASEAGLALTDFDEFCLAPAALDPATYAAYFVRGQQGDLEAALTALARLVSGYGREPDHLAWYVATMILRRAARPFRYFEAEWPARVAGMVSAAEGALDGAR